MIGIDDALRRARTGSAAWTVAAAMDIATGIAGAITPTGTIDYDDGAGETWVRVIASGRRLIALVSIELPLVISKPSAIPSDFQIDEDEISHVKVADFAERTLVADERLLREVFGDSPRLDIIDPNAFSADELWYATV